MPLPTRRHDDEVPEADPSRRRWRRAEDEATSLEQERFVICAGFRRQEASIALDLFSTGRMDCRYRNQPWTWNCEAQASGGGPALSSERGLRREQIVLMNPLGIERRRRRRKTVV